MKKILALLIIVILFNCSSDDDNTIPNRINPSQFLIGSWTMENQIIKYTITENNIIEINNNFLDGDPNDPRGNVNFANDFNNDNYILTEIPLNSSYELVIDTADSQPDEIFGVSRLYRAFEVVIENGEERVYLTYQNGSGILLIRDE